MAKLKMPMKELGAEMSPVSPDPDADIQEQGGVQEPSDLIGGTNTSELVQVDLTEPDLTEDNSIIVTKAFNCYYSGQFLSFKKDQEVEDGQLAQYLLGCGAPIEVKVVK